MSRKMRKKTDKFYCLAGLFLGLVFLVLTGCTAEDRGRPAAEAEETAQISEPVPDGEVQIGAAPQEEPAEDVVILYTNDTHGAADENLGFAKVAGLKKELLKTTERVLLVDCGDHTQGSNLASVSKGLYLVEIMNKAGYDYATLGNHEFDYGLEVLRTNMMAAQYQYLCCNVSYTGKGTDPLFGLKNYEIVDLGGMRIALIGVTTVKSTIRSDSTAADGGRQISFHSGTVKELAACVQNVVDECRMKGAQKVVLLSHLGDVEEGTVTSTELIRNTSGIDVVLDAHSHSVIPQETVDNQDGEPVIRSSTGTKLENVGKLVLCADGSIKTELISEISQTDPETAQYIQKIKTAYEDEMQVVIGTSAYDLLCGDADGVEMIRARETNLGDLCCDALRIQLGAAIGFKNAATIRADISSGDITRGAVLTAQPYDTENVKIRTSGKHILEALEYGARLTQAKYKDSEGNPVGEFKGFLQVSGLRYTIDTKVESSVELDADGRFAALGENRRVKNVEVEQEDGTWTALDPDREYTLAVSSYLAVNGGGGFTMFKGDEVLDTGGDDYTVLSQYIEKDMEGVIPEKYKASQGRIKVK